MEGTCSSSLVTEGGLLPHAAFIEPSSSSEEEEDCSMANAQGVPETELMCRLQCCGRGSKSIDPGTGSSVMLSN